MQKHRVEYDFDNVDLQILQLLIKDARMSYTDIAKKLYVSPGTVHVRMRKLEKLKVPKRYQMMPDYTKLGFDITAFLGIYLEKNSMYDEVAKALSLIPEVVNLHYTTGAYSMFLKIICRDTQHLREVLHDKIQRIKGIQRTETLLSLEESIDRALDLQIRKQKT
jgi:Lrp/AsnC family transcriptional regulator for asnA, asnC and gidA